MSKTLKISALIMLICCAFFARSGDEKLAVGDKAPDIKLQDDQGNWRTLSEFGDKRIVLYFYPKDYTPGCTKEACSLRDFSEIYKKNNIIVIGVSYDSPESHKAFKEKYKLPFILLSDPDKSVSKKYGAHTGILTYFAPKRITYLIENGRIKHIFKKVNIDTQAQEIVNIFTK